MVPQVCTHPTAHPAHVDGVYIYECRRYEGERYWAFHEFFDGKRWFEINLFRSDMERKNRFSKIKSFFNRKKKSASFCESFFLKIHYKF